MKIGITSCEYARWGESQYKKMLEDGFSAVDYDFCNTETAPYTLSDDEAKAYLLKEKEKIENSGLIISQVHGPWRWPAKDSTNEERTERMEKMKRSVKFASLLGCKYLVIHPIMPFGTDERNNDELSKKTWDMNKEFMSELLKTAKKYEVVICFENMPMPNFSLGSPSDILRFVKEMNDDNFKICFDTGHAVMFNESTVGDFMRECSEEIKVFHIHDNNGWADLHYIPYFGIIDWKDFWKAINDIGFDGVFSLECATYPRVADDDYESICKMKYKAAKRIMEEK